MQQAAFRSWLPDTETEPAGLSLNREALLSWLNNHPDFAPAGVAIRDAVIVGQEVHNPDRIVLVLVLERQGRTYFAPFTFFGGLLRPFIAGVVPKQREVGQ